MNKIYTNLNKNFKNKLICKLYKNIYFSINFFNKIKLQKFLLPRIILTSLLH